jgi:hypothetical protein
MGRVWNKIPRAISLLNQNAKPLLISKAISSSNKVCIGQIRGYHSGDFWVVTACISETT